MINRRDSRFCLTVLCLLLALSTPAMSQADTLPPPLPYVSVAEHDRQFYFTMIPPEIDWSSGEMCQTRQYSVVDLHKNRKSV